MCHLTVIVMVDLATSITKRLIDALKPLEFRRRRSHCCIYERKSARYVLSEISLKDLYFPCLQHREMNSR